MKTAISVTNECRAPGLELGVRVSLLLFTNIIFKLTIEICMRKIISEMKYFKKSMIYQILKFFQRMPLSRDDPKTFILLGRYQKYRFIDI